MKQFWTVFQFELSSYGKSKSFVLTTLLLVVLLFGASFLPRVVDMSSMLGIESTKDKTDNKDDEKEVRDLAICDETGLLPDVSVLEQVFEQAGVKVKFQKVDGKDALSKKVEQEDVKAGFLVQETSKFDYYIINTNGDSEVDVEVFQQIMQSVHKQEVCSSYGVEQPEVLLAALEQPVESNMQILGKDMESNFWYCYVLVIVIFMIIIYYGVMIATAVTTEKSNRAIEVLVTSVDSTYLLFGKVFAGAVAAFIQVGSILASALVGYSVNHTYWGDKLDMILKIPGNVLVTFAVFGLGGFLFYAFLYGAVGALVSKTEDIGKTAGSLQMIIMIVYFAVLTQLQNVDGIIMKVCSFLPVSSYSAMFVRIGMGKVSMVEVVISAIILYASIFFAGWIGAKIYRMGTLRYGNPIKIGNALKDLKNVD